MTIKTDSFSSTIKAIKYLEKTDHSWKAFLDTEGAHERIKQSIKELIKKDLLHVATVDAPKQK